MAKLSKVDAAKAAGVSRQTLYTYLNDGRLSADADGLIDTAELLRAGFTLHPGHDIGRQDVTPPGQPLTSRLDTLDVYQDMIVLLKQQLSEAQPGNRPRWSAKRRPATGKPSCSRWAKTCSSGMTCPPQKCGLRSPSAFCETVTIVQTAQIENSSVEMIRYYLSLIPEAFKLVWAHVNVAENTPQSSNFERTVAMHWN